MTSHIAQAGPELTRILSSTHDADSLLQCFQEFLSSLPCPCPDVEALIAVLHSAPTPQEPIGQLLEAELLLFFDPGNIDSCRVDTIFKNLSYLSTTNSLSPGTSTPLTRVKYNDLFTDYQFLLSPKVKDIRLVDLVTKKINILALITDLNGPHTPNLIDHVRQKILVYYLLCDSDYRTKSVLKFLQDEGIAKAASLEITEFLIRRSKVTKVQDFRELVDYLQRIFYPVRAIVKLHAQGLLENHLDNNLSKLPTYYTSVSIPRLEILLGSEDVDLEDLLYKMITHNKFPHGAAIDQIAEHVYFLEKPAKYGEFDAHVKKVCDTVDQISASLPERAKEKD